MRGKVGCWYRSVMGSGQDAVVVVLLRLRLVVGDIAPSPE